MSRFVRLAFASLVLAVPPTFAQAQTTPAQGTVQSAAMSAEDFVVAASASNMFEIRSSELALQNAQGDRVRAFAEQMIADHTKAGEQLMTIVAEGGASVAPPAALDARHQAMMDQLKAASGEQFDAAYLGLQLQAHEEAVALFTAYAENGRDETLRAFAATTLPVLQHHLSEVEALAGRT